MYDHATRMRRRLRPKTIALYARNLFGQFRWTLLLLVGAVILGGALYHATPHAQLHGERPSLFLAFYCAWMALFAQGVLQPPETWYLVLISGLYPLIGYGLVVEGAV